MSLKVTTENNSASNFNYTVSSWNSGGRISGNINRRTSTSGNFLDISLLDPNFLSSPRQCTLEIVNKTDPSKKVVISIYQEGNRNARDEFEDIILEPIPGPTPDLGGGRGFGNGLGNLY